MLFSDKVLTHNWIKSSMWMYPFYTEAALKTVSIAADLYLANFKVLCFPIEARISKWHSCFYGVGSESEECGKPMKCSRRYSRLPFFRYFLIPMKKCQIWDTFKRLFLRWHFTDIDFCTKIAEKYYFTN